MVTSDVHSPRKTSTNEVFSDKGGKVRSLEHHHRTRRKSIGNYSNCVAFRPRNRHSKSISSVERKVQIVAATTSDETSLPVITEDKIHDLHTSDEKSTEVKSLASKETTSEVHSLHRGDGESEKTKSLKKKDSDSLTKSVKNTQELCPICKRFYGSNSFTIHIRACEIARDLKLKKKAADKRFEERLNRNPCRPPGMLCHICGGRYTQTSWNLHIPHCLKKWTIWNERLPRGHQRKSFPIRPNPTDEDIALRISKAKVRGEGKFTREDAVDEIIHEESVRNQLPLHLIS